MTLNAQQDEYVAEAGDTAGIMVAILQQNQMPSPEDHGFLIIPGHATSVVITQVSKSLMLSVAQFHKNPTEFEQVVYHVLCIYIYYVHVLTGCSCGVEAGYIIVYGPYNNISSSK